MKTKKSFLYILTAIIITLLPADILTGQGLAEKYFNAKFQYSSQNIKVNQGMYNVTYLGEGATYTKFYDMNRAFRSNLYQFSLGFGKYKGFNHMVCFDLLRGDVEKGQFGYFLGYNVAFEGDKNDFLIRPALGLLGGNTNITFEEVKNQDGLIDLYGNKYKADYAIIMQKFSSWAIRPSVTFTYLIRQLVGINAEIGYDLAIESKNGKYKTEFVKFDHDDMDVEHDIRDENYSVIYPNGEISKSRLYGLTGFYWSVGISLYKSYDYD